jgi:hypothetical protein
VPKPTRPAIILANSVPPLAIPLKMMASEPMPVPEVVCRVRVEPAPEPPMSKGLVIEVATATVPVKLATLEIVWLLIRPAVRAVAKRFVELAVVANKLVVVAEAPVAFENVKFCSVVEPIAKRLVVEPVTKLKVLAKKFVVVAEVPVAFEKVKF